MEGEDVRAHLETTKIFLIRVSKKFAAYLDDYNTRIVMEEGQHVIESKEYIRQIFKQLRRMEVLVDEACFRVTRLLQSDRISQVTAEQTLYKIYQKCIMEFFSPQNDVWYEESRAAYTNRLGIKFRSPAPLALERFFSELEPGFQEIRETLDYYDSKFKSNSI